MPSLAARVVSQQSDVCPLARGIRHRQLKFVNHQEFQRVGNERGECWRIYADVDGMGSELLKRTPQDATEIRHFAGAIRRLAKLRMPDPEEPVLTLLRSVPALPLLRQLSRISGHDYGKRFRHPLLKASSAKDKWPSCPRLR